MGIRAISTDGRPPGFKWAAVRTLLLLCVVPHCLTDRDLRRALNAAEHAELARLYDDGTISQPTRLRLQRGLDLEATRLSDEHH